MRLPKIHSAEELDSLVEELGFLPFFNNCIPGYSVEECTSSKYWFVEGVEGPWEWKGPVIRTIHCGYGKVFKGKAGYVSRKWYADFANWRRNGYDFDARCDDDLVPFQDKYVYDLFQNSDTLLSHAVKNLGGFGKDGRKGFETIITRLQMECYITTDDFEYMHDKNGNQYGWGIARYTTPEYFFGKQFKNKIYTCEPDESRNKIVKHLKKTIPDITEDQILFILGTK